MYFSISMKKHYESKIDRIVIQKCFKVQTVSTSYITSLLPHNTSKQKMSVNAIFIAANFQIQFSRTNVNFRKCCKNIIFLHLRGAFIDFFDWEPKHWFRSCNFVLFKRFRLLLKVWTKNFGNVFIELFFNLNFRQNKHPISGWNKTEWTSLSTCILR